MASDESTVSPPTVESLVTSISQEVLDRSAGDLLTQEMITAKVAENIEASSKYLEDYYTFLRDHAEDIEGIEAATEQVRRALSANYASLGQTLREHIAVSDMRYAKLSADVNRYLVILSDITTDSKQITADNGEINAGAWTILSQARKWDLDILKKLNTINTEVQETIRDELESFLDGQLTDEEIITKVMEEIASTPIIQELDAKLKESVEVQLAFQQKLIDEANDRAEAIRDAVVQLTDESNSRVEEIRATVDEVREDLYGDFLNLKDSTGEEIEILQETVTELVNVTIPGLATSTAFEGLSVRVTRSENDIAAISTRLTDLSSVVDGKASSTALSALTTRVTATERNITSQSTSITDLTNKLNNKADSSAVTALTNRVTKTENTLTTQGSSITSLNNALTGKASNAAVTDLTSRVTEAEGKITTQGAAITNLTGTVAGKADGSAVTALTNRVNAAEGNISSTQSNVVNLASSLSTGDNLCKPHAWRLAGQTGYFSNTGVEGSFTDPSHGYSGFILKGQQRLRINITVPEPSNRYLRIHAYNKDKEWISRVFQESAVGSYERTLPVGTEFIRISAPTTGDSEQFVAWLADDLSGLASSSALDALQNSVSLLRDTVTAEASKITKLESNVGSSSDNVIVNPNISETLEVPLVIGTIVDLAKDTTTGTSLGTAVKISVPASTTMYGTAIIAPAFRIKEDGDARNLGTQQGDILVYEFECFTTVSRNIRATFDMRGTNNSVINTVTGSAPTGTANSRTVTAGAWHKFVGRVEVIEGTVSTTCQVRINTVADASTVYVRNIKLYRESAKDYAEAEAISSLTTRTTALESISTQLTSLTSSIKLAAEEALDVVTIKDTRDTDELPSWYMSRYAQRKVNEFKSQATIGVSALLGSGSWCTLETLVMYTEVGNSYQVIQTATSSTDPQNYAQRRSNGLSEWSDWVQPFKDLRTNLNANATATNSLTTRVTAAEGKITSQASSLTTLTSTVNDATSTLTAQGKVVDGLQASYVVKMNTNGTIASFGMVQSTGALGNVVSAFGVVADNFYVGAPSSNKKPFMVTTTTTTVNGVSYPAGTWIDVAFIANATIGTAKIADAAITNAKIANATIESAKIKSLDAAKITSGTIDAARITVGSGTTFEDGYHVGWKIITAATNLNTMLTTGRYLLKGTLTNAPVSGWTYLVVDKADSARATQTIWKDTNPTDRYTRTVRGSAATPAFDTWKRDTVTDQFESVTSVVSGTTVIEGGSIRTGTITANKLNVTSLSAISANLGTIKVGTANIGDLQVSSLKIADNAVTIPSTAYSAAEIVVNSTSWVDVASLFVEASEGSALVLFNATYNVEDAGGVNILCRILRGSTVVRAEFQIIAAGLVGGNSIRPSGSASTTYLETGKRDDTIKIQMRLGSGPKVSLTHRSITSLVVKK